MNLTTLKSGKKENIINFVREQYEQSKNNMIDYHRNWALNLAWVRGHQYVDFDRYQRKFTKPKDFDTRIRVMSNFLFPLYRKIVSRFSFIKPVWDAIPATPDEDDIQIAETGTQVLKDTWLRTKMTKKLITTLSWQTITGNCFQKIDWDAEAGDPYYVNSTNIAPSDMQQLMELMGIYEAPEQLELNTGDLCVDVVSPFNIITDDDITDFNDASFVIETQLHSIDWLSDKFGNKAKELTETTEVDTLIYPNRYKYERKDPPKGVLCHSVWVKKSKKFKKGLYAYIAGGEILKSPQDSPHEHGQIPYVHFQEILDPSCMWGTCAIEQVRSNQARYNSIQSSITEQINKMSNLQWLVPYGAGDINLTNKPGAIIRYRGSQAPEQVQLRPIPSYIERALDRTRADIQDTASTHDVSEAKADPNIRSGKAVIALQEADDTVYGPSLQLFDDSLAKVGSLVLQTMSQYVTEDRVVQVRGEFNSIQTLTFNRANLKGKNNANYWQVRVSTYGRDSMSRYGREQHLTRLMQLGVLNPQTDRALILNMLGTADTITMFDEKEVERARQWREIQTIIGTNQQVNVIEKENHLSHIETISKFIAGSQRDKIKPEQLKLIIDHLHMHEQMMMLENQKMQQILGMTQGAPNGR